ncbi:MAG: ABC transporter ATP-binding protein/permease [Methanobrevibacter woesei]|uniref:ABC transporter ATP-binding protein n=1 Tax=Methanobrevibacter woesei TaxID=190976 RepID=UPI0023F5206C|nr:ABC transporter ATP-binding protein [Methanobrevibacter woesei]MCI7291011.1 ABC transporter ATP-binding protein/permease [Methanobrevibacter woesei]
MAKKSLKGNYSISAILKRLGGYFYKDKKKVIFAVLIVVIGNFALVMAPKLCGNIIDLLSAYVSNGYGFLDMNNFISLILMIAGLYIFGNVATIISNKIMIDVSRDVTFKLRRNIVKKLNKVPINYLDVTPTGDIMARLTNDLLTVESLLESDLISVIVQLIIIILVFIMMLIVNPLLTLVYIVILPVAFLITKYITTKTKKQFKQQQSSVGELNGFMGDNFNNHTLIKTYNMEDESINTFKTINQKFHKSYVKAKFISGFILPISLIINNVGYIALSVFGAYLIIQGSLSIGGFLAFLLYGQMLNSPLSSIASSMNQVQSGFSSVERVFEILDVEEESNDDDKDLVNVDKVKGEIEFEHVEFGYVPEKQLFYDVSLNAEPGMVMAIVGPSGAGKTTLINLLMRFYDINSGKILLDGKDINSMKRTELRNVFGMVLQDSWVFDGTIAENIAYGKENATMEEIMKVSRIVGCDTFIDTLPDGHNTFISEENSQLSVGEKQLLVLARTVLSNPKILILDEATSQMDTRTEAMVTRAMEKLMEGRTTFIIAHRLFTIKNADKIIFMKDGDIKEVGSHEELLKLNGLYAEMYRNASS